MAVRKLSLPLFPSKPRVSQPRCSTHYLHFIATVSQKTDQYALVCESQPSRLLGATASQPVAQPAVPKSTSRRMRMLISKDNGGKTIGWRETYFSKDESVEVSVHRNVSTITTRDRTTGKVDSKTFIGRTPLPSDFDGKK
jgi:hypothetical protein